MSLRVGFEASEVPDKPRISLLAYGPGYSSYLLLQTTLACHDAPMTITSETESKPPVKCLLFLRVALVSSQ